MSTPYQPRPCWGSSLTKRSSAMRVIQSRFRWAISTARNSPSWPNTGAAGFRQLGVEVYGGVLLNSWLDRELGSSNFQLMAWLPRYMKWWLHAFGPRRALPSGTQGES